MWDGQFTPYGRTHAIAGTVQNPLRFPGQWADPAAGYFYNYMRDYDPTLARYLSSDPIGVEGGRNRYAYVAANPQSRIDPHGLEDKWYGYNDRAFRDWVHGEKPRMGRKANENFTKAELDEMYKDWVDRGKPRGRGGKSGRGGKTRGKGKWGGGLPGVIIGLCMELIDDLVDEIRGRSDPCKGDPDCGKPRVPGQ
ncbi:MAG: RHS repeat-associated core domain-containing protein [Alphaproteobacteria bacterium]